MIRSMTGYGRGESAVGDARILVEIRAVNHRYADIRLRTSSVLHEHAQIAEEIARKHLERGRIEIGFSIEGELGGPPMLDRDRARAAFQQLAALRDELRPEEPVPLSLLSCVPNLFRSSAVPEPQQLQQAIRTATDQACERVDEMREREGRSLDGDLRTRLDRLERQLGRLENGSTRVVDDYRAKLRERLTRLLRDTSTELEPGRLEHEVALFADRADVAEELSRLHSHCSQFRQLLDQPEPGAVGRRLDFLLQEMAREANTVGAKCADAEMSADVVELKADLERMREQAQNVL